MCARARAPSGWIDCFGSDPERGEIVVKKKKKKKEVYKDKSHNHRTSQVFTVERNPGYFAVTCVQKKTGRNLVLGLHGDMFQSSVFTGR